VYVPGVVSLIYKYTHSFEGVLGEVFEIDDFSQFMYYFFYWFGDHREKRLHWVKLPDPRNSRLFWEGVNVSFSLPDKAATKNVDIAKAATIGRWKSEYLEFARGAGGMGGALYLTPDKESTGRCVIPSVGDIKSEVTGMSCFTDVGGRDFILVLVLSGHPKLLYLKFFDARTGQPTAEPFGLPVPTWGAERLVGARYSSGTRPLRTGTGRVRLQSSM